MNIKTNNWNHNSYITVSDVLNKKEIQVIIKDIEEQIKSVFYLQNPDVFCGTYLNQDGKDIIIPGHENSLVVFDGKILHDAVFPETKLLKNKPRYTLITDFN
jgi:hypothetical protein